MNQITAANPLRKHVATTEAALAKLGKLTALPQDTSLWRRMRRRDDELAAASAPSMACPAAAAAKVPSATAHRATGILANAATPAAPPTPPKNAAAALASTDAELYDYWAGADQGDSNILSGNPDGWARIRNESRRRHFKR